MKYCGCGYGCGCQNSCGYPRMRIRSSDTPLVEKLLLLSYLEIRPIPYLVLLKNNSRKENSPQSFVNEGNDTLFQTWEVDGVAWSCSLVLNFLEAVSWSFSNKASARRRGISSSLTDISSMSIVFSAVISKVSSELIEWCDLITWTAPAVSRSLEEIWLVFLKFLLSYEVDNSQPCT